VQIAGTTRLFPLPMAAGRVAAATAMLGRLLLLLLLLAVASDANDGGSQPPISRRSFPEGFIFGTASSAYQVMDVPCNNSSGLIKLLGQ